MSSIYIQFLELPTSMIGFFITNDLLAHLKTYYGFWKYLKHFSCHTDGQDRLPESSEMRLKTKQIRV